MATPENSPLPYPDDSPPKGGITVELWLSDAETIESSVDRVHFRNDTAGVSVMVFRGLWHRFLRAAPVLELRLSAAELSRPRSPVTSRSVNSAA